MAVGSDGTRAVRSIHLLLLSLPSKDRHKPYLSYNRKLTRGIIAQNIGDEFLRMSVNTRPIFFFLIMDLSKALKVRLLPEYIYNGWGHCRSVRLDIKTYEFIRIDES
jgi:hypothetical protein